MVRVLFLTSTSSTADSDVASTVTPTKAGMTTVAFCLQPDDLIATPAIHPTTRANDRTIFQKRLLPTLPARTSFAKVAPKAASLDLVLGEIHVRADSSSVRDTTPAKGTEDTLAKVYPFMVGPFDYFFKLGIWVPKRKAPVFS